jgi:hypothetical protein
MLYLRFAVDREDLGIDDIVRPVGALFTRWLPDGREDAVRIPTCDNRNSLEFWFERRGCIRDGRVVFDHQKTEIDEALMRRQAKLDAGPLHGAATFVHVTEEEMMAVREVRTGTDEYVALAKRIVDFLYPYVSQFVEVLRTRYGQYWLREIKNWDSRRESLGSYCSSILRLRWSENQDKDWRWFEPTKNIIKREIRLYSEDFFRRYLTQEDWHDLKSSPILGQPVSLASKALLRAHELLDQGDLKYAFVEIVTALQLSLGEYILNKQNNSTDLTEMSRSFYTIPLRAQLAILGSLVGISQQTILDGSEGVDIRNKIVHEGFLPTKNHKRPLDALFQIVGRLNTIKKPTFPALISGNRLFPSESSPEG